ncbi:DUF547 domain-containing protein [Maribacter sp. 2-571]|uniref:DUF547 domain-containing protein n=1 Tax=Maribacter sp. 2-571 TaxID=3417569 RepID=UPI003D352E57
MQYIALLLFLFTCSASGPAQNVPTYSSVDHALWNELLQKYVDDDGNVDYGRFKEDETKLKEYLTFLGDHPIAETADKQEKLAYYINLYNAATVQLILNHYPTNSIKDISRPWSKDFVKIGSDYFSLGHIEHKVLRKMKEPRIHFAINCASYSCPKLKNVAFTADQMEQQLERTAREFINDPKRNTIAKDRASLSQIFKWFKKDFTKKSSLRQYINQYANTPIDGNAAINYKKYDWSLNEAE